MILISLFIEWLLIWLNYYHFSSSFVIIFHSLLSSFFILFCHHFHPLLSSFSSSFVIIFHLLFSSFFILFCHHFSLDYSQIFRAKAASCRNLWKHGTIYPSKFFFLNNFQPVSGKYSLVNTKLFDFLEIRHEAPNDGSLETMDSGLLATLSNCSITILFDWPLFD